MNLPANKSQEEKAYWRARALRPRNVPASVLLYIVATGFSVPGWRVFLTGICLYTAYGIVTLWNDLSDKKIDQYNHKNTPLILGELTEQDYAHLSYYLFILLVVCSLPLGLVSILLIGIYLILGRLYSYGPRLSARPISSLVLLGYCYSVHPVLLGLAQSNQSLTGKNILALIMVLVFSMSILPLKDISDIAGDKKFNKKTLVVFLGWDRTKQQMVSWTIFASVGGVLLLLSYDEVWYALFAFVVTLLCATQVLLLLRHKPPIRNIQKSAFASQVLVLIPLTHLI